MHENRGMPGEMVTPLLGAQGGDEESFACLYAVTNPVLVRYVRVVSDADPASVALSTWSTLLDGLSVCVADDDDDWLELAVGTARQSALAFSAMDSTAMPVPEPAPAVPARHGLGPEPDPVDAGVAMLRACGPAVADVLALGIVAGLGRDSIARITGQEPTEVLALVQDGQLGLALPLETLIATMRVPGSPAELGDLPTVMPLFAAQSHSALTTTAATAASVGAVTVVPDLATASLATGAVSTAASAGPSTVADLLTWDSPAAASSSVALLRADAPSRWASIGASAAAWTIAVGGLGAAAAMSGVIPAAIDGLFGDEGNRPVIVAQGPIRPGEAPPQSDGGLGAEPGPSGQQPSPQGPAEPSIGPVDTSTGGDGVVVSAAMSGFGTATQSAVVVPAVLTNSPSPVSAPTTPSRPAVTPPSSTPQPPRTGTGTSTGAGHAYGKGHVKHSTGLAKGRAKAGQAAAKGHAKAARAQAKAAAAKARATAKAAAAKAKAAAAKAKAAAKAEAAKSRA